MSLRTHLALAIILPLLVLGAVTAAGYVIPIPHFGREYVLRILLPDQMEKAGLPQVLGPRDSSRPLVVIDAGHGGRDPGAVGEGIREKDVTLALATALRDELVAQGGVRVAMTRDDDRLLSLDERPDIARRLEADLFISIHADSAGETSDVSGASLYTLSNRASSAAAARFARRENDADRLNGISIEGQDAEVSKILVELSQRYSREESIEFAQLITREGEGRITFLPPALRAADLVVLRTPDMPSVLFESGFVTSADDAERLLSLEGRKTFADVLTRAIKAYFVRQAQD